METDQIIWNEQRYFLFGMKPGNQQLFLYDVLKHIHPGDVKDVEQQLRKSIDETSVYKAEFRIIRDDNEKVRWMNGYGWKNRCA